MRQIVSAEMNVLKDLLHEAKINGIENNVKKSIQINQVPGCLFISFQEDFHVTL